MRRPTLLLTLPLLFLAGVASADFENGYFPVADGNEWIYQPNDGGAQTRVHIDQRTTYQGSVYHRLRGFNGDLHWVKQPADGDVMNVNRRWYRLGAAPGTSWTFQVTPDSVPGSNGARLAVVRRSERVRTPAGLFDCVRVRWDTGGDGITDEWFARGIGLVQRRERRNGRRVDLELVSARVSGQQVAGGSTQPAPAQPATPPPVAQGAFGIVGQVPAARVQLRVILAQAMGKPSGMAFHPRDGSLWIVDRERDNTLVIHDPGLPTMRGNVHHDDSNHFNNNPMAIAFSRTRLEHATALEGRNDYNQGVPGNNFMGPTLFTSDESIFEGGHPSHLDMVHHSPMAVGIAAGLPRTSNDPREYWVFNGDAGSIDRYFFRQPHVLGGHDHADGLTFRYGSGLSPLPEVPGHLALDVATGILYIADSGNGRIARLDPSATSINSSQPIQGYNAQTPLYRVPGATIERVTAAGALTQPAGLIISGGRLVVSDHGTGHVLVFSLDGTLEGKADTGLGPNVLMGLAETPDGRLFVLDGDQGRVLELSVSGS